MLLWLDWLMERLCSCKPLRVKDLVKIRLLPLGMQFGTGATWVTSLVVVGCMFYRRGTSEGFAEFAMICCLVWLVSCAPCLESLFIHEDPSNLHFRGSCKSVAWLGSRGGVFVLGGTVL